MNNGPREKCELVSLWEGESVCKQVHGYVLIIWCYRWGTQMQEKQLCHNTWLCTALRVDCQYSAVLGGASLGPSA